MTMEIRELGHVVLFVRDLEASRRFYGEILGFPALPVEMPGAAMFSTGRTHHELLLIEVGADATPIPAGRRVGMYHFGLKVGDTDDELRAALAELQAAGVQVVGATDHTVTHSLYVLDPDGNELELYVDVEDADWRNDPTLIAAEMRPLRL
jgi:catechol 2,3-dioxygenase